MPSKKRKTQKYDETCMTSRTHTILRQDDQPSLPDKSCDALPQRTSSACNSAQNQAGCLSFETVGECESYVRPDTHNIIAPCDFDANMKTPSRHRMPSGLASLFFERSDVRAWYSGLSDTLPPVTPGYINPRSLLDESTAVAHGPLVETHRRERGRALFGGDFERVDADTEMNARLPEPKPMSDRCSDNLYTERELAEMDANMAFVIPSESRVQEIRQEAVKLMALASAAMIPCAICELSCLHSDITAKVLTNEFVAAMQRCLIPHSDADIPAKASEQYDVSDVDPRLEGLLLYRSAITKPENDVIMNICSTCRNYVESQKHTVPPCLAIANGNYIGALPPRFTTLSRTDEQAVALDLPCVSLSVVTGGACKTIKSHHYVVKNTEGPIVEMLPRDVSSRVRVTMVGSMTTAQAAACKKRYQLNLSLCGDLLRFLKQHNVEYENSTASDEPGTVLMPTTRTSVIFDKTTVAGTDTENGELARIVRDDSTYSTFGSAVDEAAQSNNEDTWIGGSSFLMQPQQHSLDVLVRKSNAYVSLSRWGVCVRMFPTLFPYGCGGPTEPRQNRISLRRWILRSLQVDGHRFETHYAFMLLAFDFLATQKARETMYVKMNIKREAIKAAAIPRSTIRDAIKYFNHLTACRSKGMKPRPPSLDVQRVIDVRKGLHIPESNFYGSNSGRMRARHHLFGMLKRFGPLQIFFTVSPDSAGTYNIAVKAGRVTETAIREANLALVPNRAERKSIAATHPVECARYFLRVMHTVFEVLLGWDLKAQAPKRGGGIFGVVRAFGAAAETQVAGDLHAHIAVWLHGFPTTASGYQEAIETNSTFRDRIIGLANQVLCTKPPCIRDELQCPNCSDAESLIPVVPGIDAFRRPAPGTAPPTTSRCSACGCTFRDKDIIETAIEKLANQQNVQLNSQLIDFEKCRPPLNEDAGILATSLLVRDVQVHYWNHCKSCFKVSSVVEWKRNLLDRE